MKRTLMILGLCLCIYSSKAWRARLGTVKDYTKEGNSVSFRCELSTEWCFAIIDDKLYVYWNNCRIFNTNQEEENYDPVTELYTFEVIE